MHSRIISNSNDRWKGIEDVDVKMVIFYVILSKDNNIMQVEIYDEETLMNICGYISVMRSTNINTGETV